MKLLPRLRRRGDEGEFAATLLALAVVVAKRDLGTQDQLVGGVRKEEAHADGAPDLERRGALQSDAVFANGGRQSKHALVGIAGHADFNGDGDRGAQ